MAAKTASKTAKTERMILDIYNRLDKIEDVISDHLCNLQAHNNAPLETIQKRSGINDM